MELLEISIKEIDIKDNYRSDKKEREVHTLMQSIKTDGLLQPVIVRAKIKGKYELLAGHRRYAAIKKLGWSKISAVIQEKTVNKKIINGIENLIRENANSYDIGRLLYAVKKEESMSDDEIGVRFGLSQNEVKSYIVLFQKTPPKYRKIVRRVVNGKGKRGIISNSVAGGIINMQKSNLISTQQVEKLFSVAKSNPSFSGDKIQQIARVLRTGGALSTAVNSAKETSSITIRCMVSESDQEKLKTKYGIGFKAEALKVLSKHFKTKFF